VASDDLSTGPLENPLAQALALAAPHPGERVLDLSGHAGLVALKLAESAASVEVIQPHQELAEEGRRLARSMHTTNLYFHTGPLHVLPFDSGQFQLVVWCRGLAREPRPLGTLAEIARVLQRAGRLVLQEVMAFGHPPLDLKIWELERRRDPAHLLYYTEGELEDMLSLSGFTMTRRERGSMTQDFGYWASGTDMTEEESAEMRRTFFTLPPGDQDRIDLALSDGQISFAYPVTTVLARPS
jgi:SAM-dependent methyltransferase